LGAKSPLRENFQSSSITVQYGIPIDVFTQKFMVICPVTKKSKFIVPLRNTHLFSAVLHPFGRGRQNFNTWDISSAYICL